MSISKFTNTNLHEIQAEIAAAMAVIATKHGISLVSKYEKGTAASLSFRLKADLKIAGVVMSQGRIDFERGASHVNLSAADFGRTFIYKGRSYRITGLNLSAWRFPVNTERQPDGKPFRFPAETVKGLLPAIKKAA